jgi:hypothetical protein
MTGGWSLKKLVRSLVISAAYRQSAATSKTAEDLYGGMRMRRLTAEQLRDAMLFAAGSLSTKADGPPIWPDLPSEILVANPAFLDDNAEKTKGWYPSPPPEQKCRTIFLVQKRTVRVPLLEAFDLPENAVPCGRRNVSTVAPQALSLLNSPFAVGVAGDFASRVAKEAGQDPSRQIDRAYALALQRAADPQERDLCMKLLRSRSLPELCRAILNLNEFAYVD